MPYPRLQTENLSEEQRECLILKHLPQVRRLARRIHARLPESVSLDDLVSTGVVGLISAIDRFDPSHHAQLRTYAEHKIRGGILEGLRRLDWGSRQQRQRARQIEVTRSKLEQRLHEPPTDEQIAAELGIPVARYHKWRATPGSSQVDRFDAKGFEASNQHELLQFVSADPKEMPSVVFERRELARALATAISELPATHRTVLSLYYRDELRLGEIARISGMKEGRVCQIKRQAILHLRACMAKLWPTAGTRYCSQG